MNPNTPNLTHRLNNYTVDNPEPHDLSDAIDAITGRAFSAISLLQDKYAFDTGSRLNDEITYMTLQSIEMELQDIKATVEHFYQKNKKSG